MGRNVTVCLFPNSGENGNKTMNALGTASFSQQTRWGLNCPVWEVDKLQLCQGWVLSPPPAPLLELPRGTDSLTYQQDGQLFCRKGSTPTDRGLQKAPGQDHLLLPLECAGCLEFTVVKEAEGKHNRAVVMHEYAGQYGHAFLKNEMMPP